MKHKLSPIAEQLSIIAKSLGLTPTYQVWARVSFRSGVRQWWLIGLEEDDYPLPGTEKCLTMRVMIETVSGAPIEELMKEKK